VQKQVLGFFLNHGPQESNGGHNRGNCFYMCLYRKNIFIPRTTSCERDVASLRACIIVSLMAYGKSQGTLLHYQLLSFTYFSGIIKELYSFSSQMVKYFFAYLFSFKPNKRSYNNRLDLLPFGFECRLEIIV
jgi:hypothetical protein